MRNAATRASALIARLVLTFHEKLIKKHAKFPLNVVGRAAQRAVNGTCSEAGRAPIAHIVAKKNKAKEE